MAWSGQPEKPLCRTLLWCLVMALLAACQSPASGGRALGQDAAAGSDPPPAADAQEEDAAGAIGTVARGPVSREVALQARGDFISAQKELKKYVGELTSLQTEAQRKGADRVALEAKYSEAMQGAKKASTLLETSALMVARGGMPRQSDEDYGAAMPIFKQAIEVCAAVVAASIQTDDPVKALRLIDTMESIGIVNGDLLKMGATAAMILSEVDLAESYLSKLNAAGGSPEKQSELAELQAALDEEKPKVKAELERREAEGAADDLPRVKLETSAGEIVVELFENEAPNTVANFIDLVEKGFYDGTPFHRVIGGFMAQGGDPTGSGSGGPGHQIACEVDAPNSRKHFLGSLSMAHAGKDTGGSQFFLTFRPTEHLDGKHTVFGRVIEGSDVLPKLRRTQSPEGRPMPGIKPDGILKAEVIRKRDHEYTVDRLPESKKRK